MQPHKINPSDKKLLSDTLLDHILNVSMEELSYAPIKNVKSRIAMNIKIISYVKFQCQIENLEEILSLIFQPGNTLSGS